MDDYQTETTSARTPGRVIVPVILAGGSGTRLWPLSRKQKPKQFLELTSQHSLFQETLLRSAGLSRMARTSCSAALGGGPKRSSISEARSTTSCSSSALASRL